MDRHARPLCRTGASTASTGMGAVRDRPAGQDRRALRRHDACPTTSCCWRPARMPRPSAARRPGRRPHRVPADLRRRAVASATTCCRASHVAIIGGGFIGLELAASARKRGADVTMIEALPRILMRGVPEEIAEVVAARHRAEGVEILCGVGSRRRSAQRADGVRIELADGRAIAADLAVIGIGAIPVTGWPRAPAWRSTTASPSTTSCRPRDPDIFAAGDCCSFPLAIYGGRRVRLESWRNAQDQGDARRRATCWARTSLSRRCRGSGRISMT